MQGRYLTFEKSRQRYVFQMRVPQALRAAIDNRQLIRIALGRIDESEARVRADALARHWHAKFAKARAAGRDRLNARAHTTVELELDEDIAQRALSTWQAMQVELMTQQLSRLRECDDAAWDSAQRDAADALRLAKHIARRGIETSATAAIAALSAQYAVVFRHARFEFDAFVPRFNATAVKLATVWCQVLEGDESLDAQRPDDQTLLPLTRLWGTRAKTLEALRAERLGSIGKPVRPKTAAKYQRIATGLDEVIGERPVECLRENDVQALLAKWRSAGNAPSTLVDKLTILAGLLDPIAPAVAELVRHARPRTAIARARRHPLSVEQLTALREAVALDRTHADDARLVDLMILSGARLSEVLQLSALDVRVSDNDAVLRFHDAHQLKGECAVREVPISLSGLPVLRNWLTERRFQGGPLFKEARPDAFGHYGNLESKRLNRILRTLTTDRRQVLQSTRNSAGQAMRRAGVDPRVRRRVLGHADLDIHEKHYDPGELLSVEDLMPAATALNMLATARPDLVEVGASGSVADA